MTTVIATGGVGGGQRQWSSGLFDCFSDIGVCCLGYFCLPLLICQTAQKLGENGFCVACCIPCPYNQMLLRVKIRSDNNIQGSICDDYCTVLCCQPCAACQEAREVDYVSRSGGGAPAVTVVTTQPQMQMMAPAQPVQGAYPPAQPVPGAYPPAQGEPVKMGYA